jgi:GntR family transcriptional regulator/MocR family aminotransferase
MVIQWSGLGPELPLQLDRGRGQPLRSQLEAALSETIRSGRLQAGERLPSSRELARELGVSRGLVQECLQPHARVYARRRAVRRVTSEG